MGLIPAGVLRETLTVLKATHAPNGSGGWTDTFASVGTVRGSVSARARTRDETMAAMQPTDQEHVDIYADATVVPITGDDRIETADGLTYELTSITRQGALIVAVGRKV